jgi:type II secretory pathway component GspD/PulD (secretin)
MSTPCHLTLLAVLATALLAPAAQDAQSAVRRPVQPVDGGAAVELALADASVADFLAAAQLILGVPIDSLPDEVVPARFRQSGEQRVPLAAFRDAFDSVLSRAGFWNWDDANGGAPIIVVRRALPGKFLGKVPFTARVIGLDELASGPKQRGPQYTVIFPLEHIPARDLLVVVSSLLDSANETVRHVEGSNQLMVTASREHLIAMRDALAQMDVPGPQAPGVELQVSALKLELFDVKKRLDALESKAGG